MRKSILGIAGICLVTALAILILSFPVSGGKCSGPQDGTGNQYGNHMAYSGSGYECQQMGSVNSNCTHQNCMSDGRSNQDGTGHRYGQSAKAGHHCRG